MLPSDVVLSSDCPYCSSRGIAKAFVGLSGSIAATLYTGFFKPDVTSFLLCLGLYFAGMVVGGIVFISKPLRTPVAEPENGRRSKFALMAVLYGVVSQE